MAVKLVKVPDIGVVPLRFRLLVPPFNIPAVSTNELKEWINPEPRFRVPPAPLIVSEVPPARLPVKVAIPPTFVIATAPVVEKVPIL